MGGWRADGKPLLQGSVTSLKVLVYILYKTIFTFYTQDSAQRTPHAEIIASKNKSAENIGLDTEGSEEDEIVNLEVCVSFLVPTR